LSTSNHPTRICQPGNLFSDSNIFGETRKDDVDSRRDEILQ
jgi:hypothetical protein